MLIRRARPSEGERLREIAAAAKQHWTMGGGVGSGLFRHGLERAAELGAARVEWEAEPNAVGFYERLGGRYLRPSDPSFDLEAGVAIAQ